MNADELHGAWRGPTNVSYYCWIAYVLLLCEADFDCVSALCLVLQEFYLLLLREVLQRKY